MLNHIKIMIMSLVVLPAFVGTAAEAETIGTVLSTDIGTVIDGAACRTYNVDGRTFVVAEELRSYGFDVYWNEFDKILSVTQAPYARRELLPAEQVNIRKEECSVGEPVMDILATDISVTVTGAAVESYNIDGRMVIPVRALEPYAYIEYSDEARLVTIRGLQHYLDERAALGDPDLRHEVKEYIQPVHSWHKNLGGGLVSENKYDAEVKETEMEYTGNGRIYSYFGNPLTAFYPTGADHMEECCDREIYSITGADGEWIYEADLLPRNDTGFRYIITDAHNQMISKMNEMLYGYMVEKEDFRSNFWPDRAKTNAPDMRFEKLVQDGAVSVGGYYYKLYDPEDGERHLMRYNINDVLNIGSDSYFLSRDNVLFKADFYYGYSEHYSTNSKVNEKASSTFDTLMEYDVKKAVSDRYSYYMLKTNGDVKYEGGTIASDASDICSVYGSDRMKLCVLTNGGEVYIGDADEYINGSRLKIADGVKEIFDTGSSALYYKNENGELYEYIVNNGTYEKLSENVSKATYSGQYITAGGSLMSHGKVYDTDVKDARIIDNVTYYIKNDGTLWYIKNGTGARVPAFE